MMLFSIVNNGGFLAAGNNRVSIHDVVADNIGFGGANSSYASSSLSMISQVSDSSIATAGQAVHDGVVCNHCTLVYASNATTRNVLGVSGPTIASGFSEYDVYQ